MNSLSRFETPDQLNMLIRREMMRPSDHLLRLLRLQKLKSGRLLSWPAAPCRSR